MLIDSNGNAVQAEPSRNPKVRVVQEGSHVYVDFRRDSLRRFGKIGIRGLEKHYLSRTHAPSKSVRVYTDILRAVRMAKHVREGYLSEKSKLEDARNTLELAARSTSSGDILSAIVAMDSLYQQLPARSLYKMLARAKIVSALNELSYAASCGEGSFEYFRHRNPALSLIYASISRLRRREESLLYLAQYAEERENYLRFLRDKYMHSRLDALYSALGNNGGYAVANAYISDYEMHARLQELLALCSDEHREYVLKSIARIGRRASRQNGKLRLVEILREAYSAARDRKYACARESLDEAMVFLAINKPYYFSEQLGLTGDSYTWGIGQLMDYAHCSILSGSIQKARECISEAELLLGTRLKQKTI